jgi:3-oxoacyl-[acyl-carrier-protein] synthase II
VAALAVARGVVPPTLNLDSPDPECALDWVPRVARDVGLAGALALARGMEGQAVALTLAAAP